MGLIIGLPIALVGSVPIAAGGGGAVATVWNPAFNPTPYTVTGSGLIATRDADAGGDQCLITNQGKTSGYCEFVINSVAGGGVGVGLTTPSQNPADFLGSAAFNLEWYGGDGNVYHAGGVIASWGTFGATDIVALDLKAGKLCGGKWNGSAMVWSGGDPSAGTGLDVSGYIGTAYPGVHSNTGTGSQITARFASGFSGALPTGSLAWG